MVNVLSFPAPPWHLCILCLAHVFPIRLPTPTILYLTLRCLYFQILLPHYLFFSFCHKSYLCKIIHLQRLLFLVISLGSTLLQNNIIFYCYTVAANFDETFLFVITDEYVCFSLQTSALEWFVNVAMQLLWQTVISHQSCLHGSSGCFTLLFILFNTRFMIIAVFYLKMYLYSCLFFCTVYIYTAHPETNTAIKAINAMVCGISLLLWW